MKNINLLSAILVVFSISGCVTADRSKNISSSQQPSRHIAQEANPSGDFVQINGFGLNATTAIYGNQSNSHINTLKCVWSEQAENIYSVRCGNGTSDVWDPVIDSSVSLTFNGLIMQLDGTLANLAIGPLTVKVRCQQAQKDVFVCK